MRELGSCDGRISGEHSHSIMLLLKEEGEFSISGVPWLAEGETKIVSPSTLTANCLCQKHNSALSPLDAAAGHFFAAVKSSLEGTPRSARYLISGHDIERWLLKTVKALAAKKNLALGRQPLSDSFSSDVQVLDTIDDPHGWPEGAGLYCTMKEAEKTANHSRFQLQPYTNQSGELVGFGVNILGLAFVLVLEPLDLKGYPQLRNAKYRPGQISIAHPTSTSTIGISWEDGAQHHNVLSLQFLRNVDRRVC